MDFKVGDWVEVETSLYTFAKKGTIGYVEEVYGRYINIRPVRHPELKYMNPNTRTIEAEYLKELPVELTSEDLDFFIDLALLEKDEQTFYELISRKGELQNECN